MSLLNVKAAILENFWSMLFDSIYMLLRCKICFFFQNLGLVQYFKNMSLNFFLFLNIWHNIIKTYSKSPLNIGWLIGTHFWNVFKNVIFTVMISCPDYTFVNRRHWQILMTFASLFVDNKDNITEELCKLIIRENCIQHAINILIKLHWVITINRRLYMQF